MLHEIFPHTFLNQFIENAEVKADSPVFCFQGNKLLLQQTGDKYTIPVYSEISHLITDKEPRFLFTYDSLPCFLVLGETNLTLPGFAYAELNFFRKTPDTEIAWICLVAYQQKVWHTNHAFCGVCGSPTTPKPNERAITCNDCNHTVYPQISPAIIVAIISGEKLLLANNKNFPSQWYSLVAGYVDVGETFEQAVIREVKEEVGLDVFNIRYYKSSPWPLSGSIMVGFIAEADETQAVTPDNVEIGHAAWFTRDNLPNHPPTLSIAGEMISLFEQGNLPK